MAESPIAPALHAALNKAKEELLHRGGIIPLMSQGGEWPRYTAVVGISMQSEITFRHLLAHC